MSLDVYLTVVSDAPKGEPRDAIFIRKGGATVEITRAEWNLLRPGQEPVTAIVRDEPSLIYEANITHNLTIMASAAEIYKHLWRPEEIGIAKARQLIEPLKLALGKLLADPEHFRQLNPSNGWGTYEGLVEFVRGYIAACEDYPDADVSVSR